MPPVLSGTINDAGTSLLLCLVRIFTAPKNKEQAEQFIRAYNDEQPIKCNNLLATANSKRFEWKWVCRFDIATICPNQDYNRVLLRRKIDAVMQTIVQHSLVHVMCWWETNTFRYLLQRQSSNSIGFRTVSAVATTIWCLVRNEFSEEKCLVELVGSAVFGVRHLVFCVLIVERCRTASKQARFCPLNHTIIRTKRDKKQILQRCLQVIFKPNNRNHYY